MATDEDLVSVKLLVLVYKDCFVYTNWLILSISELEPIVYISVQREINSIRCLWKEGDAITTY